MRKHEWVEARQGRWKCSRAGCTLKRSGDEVYGMWQRKEGGHWRLAAKEPIPECIGEDVAQPQPAPSPLARVREALEVSANNGTSRPQRLAKDALPVLTALETALPVLMETFHANALRVGNLEHTGKAWQDCAGCRALLEGK